MKCGHGFGDHSQDGELARWGLGRDTKWRSFYAQKRLRNAKPVNHLKHSYRVSSEEGPVLEEGVLPFRRVQSKSSLLSCTKLHVDTLKLQSNSGKRNV